MAACPWLSSDSCWQPVRQRIDLPLEQDSDKPSNMLGVSSCTMELLLVLSLE